jgi:hypothetical protein
LAVQARTGATARSGSLQRLIGLTVAVWSVALVLLLTRDAAAIAAAGSFAVGWSHLAGRCGLSHFGALTPRAKLPGQRRAWLVDVLVYVSAGAVASIAVGLVLGLLGLILVPADLRGASLGLVVLLAAFAALGDFGAIRWRLPQPNRQTRREWGFMFRPPIAAGLWGLGLGVTVATVFTFSGTWLVLTLPVALGEPAFGAAMLLAHWLGRAAPILAGPVLLPAAAATLAVLDDIERANAAFRASNVVGIALIALSIVVLLTG